MKVLHLLQSDRFSGAENVVCQIIGVFKDNPDIEMAYCSRDGQIRDALDERRIKFYPITNLKISEVKRVIREYQPDIIHAHDMRASFTAALCCGKIPLVSHIHNNSFGSRGLSVKSIAYVIAALKAKHIFWVSRSAYEGYFFKKLFKGKSSVLQNIIDIDNLYQKMNSDVDTYDYDIIYVGRLTYPKNPQRLIGVLKKVVEKLPDVKIGIIGTGDLESDVINLCNEFGMQSNVEFLGFQNNPYKMLYDSKVMIMTSRWEGTPMCALEAQSLGVPIVSTPTDGLVDIITDGENGFLSENDDVLAERLCRVVSDNELRLKISDSAKSKMQVMMDKKSYAESIAKVYGLLNG